MESGFNRNQVTACVVNFLKYLGIISRPQHNANVRQNLSFLVRKILIKCSIGEIQWQIQMILVKIYTLMP